MLLDVVLVAGAVFLARLRRCWPRRRALRPQSLAHRGGGAPASLAATVATALALTWLNPHVYLDTVVLLGSIAQSHPGRAVVASPSARPSAASCGSPRSATARRCCGRCSPAPAAWRVLDGVIAVVMTALAVSLVLRGLDAR